MCFLIISWSEATLHFFIGMNTGTYEPVNDEDDNPLVRTNEVTVEEYQHESKGTFLSSVINISNTILGSGTVAMVIFYITKPSAVAALGLGNGVALILLCAIGSGFGLFLLAIMASQSGRKASFFTCSQLTYPALAGFFDLAIAVKCFGVSISYLVITGGLLPQIVIGFYPDTPFDSIWIDKKFWITVAIIVVSPTCFLRRLDSLKYTSGFSLIAVIYLVFVVALYFMFPVEGMPAPPTVNEIDWFKFDFNTLAKLPIFVFSYTCHQNVHFVLI